MAKGKPLHTSVKPYTVSPPWTVSTLVARMAGTSFQARNLARGAEIWREMLKGETTIFFGLAGAMIPAGMRSLMVYLIQNRLIDCLVSTGANLFHDLHETLGRPHFKGEAHADDGELAQARINRIYDVLLPDKELDETEEFIADFACSLPQGKPYPSHEFFYLLGKEVSTKAKEEGMITAAAKAGVPIFCPALGDSVYGTALAAARVKRQNRLQIDITQDVVDMIRLVSTAPSTGVVLVGGGNPKNFIQQAGLCSYLFNREFPGHPYAIQITTDSPQWGGLSGCTFEEARSWRKVSQDAQDVTIYSDATIALPILVSVLAEGAGKVIGQRKPPALRELLSRSP